MDDPATNPTLPAPATLTAPAQVPDPSLVFGHYRVLTRESSGGAPYELGRGAMGITYKAVDTNLGNFVALKVINHLVLDSVSSRARFLREAKAAAQLSHDNVARVFHLGQQGENCFYAMEFIEGETLDALVRREGPLDPASALRLTAQIARGLGAAHAKGLLHRDLKPANVMLVREGDEFGVKIIDFGLVKLLDAPGGEGDDPTAGASGPSLSQGGFCGTPQYGSPEQFDADRSIDARTDLYSLGATLWFLLEGRPAFSGSLPQIVMQIFQSPLPVERLTATRHTPAPVTALLRRLMAREPEDRPADAASARKEILAALAQTPAMSTGGPGGPSGVLVPVTINEASSSLSPAAVPSQEDTATLLDAPVPTPSGVSVTFNTGDAAKKRTGLPGEAGSETEERTFPSSSVSASSAVKSAPPRIDRLSKAVIVALALLVALGGMIYGLRRGNEYSDQVYARQRADAARAMLAHGDDDGAAFQLTALLHGPEDKFAADTLRGLGEKWRKAADAIRASDPVKAAALYDKAADVGDGPAEYHLGVMRQEGSGSLTRDPTAAAEWYRRAGEKGIPEADFNLGHMYELGEGVPADLAKARVLYEKAAAAGDAAALNNLGHLYQLGLGTTRDPARAMAFYHKAADAGIATAQANLGTMYELGEGLPKPDFAQARIWFEKAAAQGEPIALVNLGALYEKGGLSPDGKPDYARAAEYYRRAATDGGLAVAQMNLGTLYMRGLGVPADAAQAVSWFRLAAQQGEIGAQYNLGVMYSTGTGVNKDPAEAAAWWRKAAEAGLLQQNSERMISPMALESSADGKDKKDKDKVAVKPMLNAGMVSGQNLMTALSQYALGLSLVRGEGVPKDPKQGMMWMARAGELGLAPAQSGLGSIYLRGHYGVPRDEKLGLEWLRRASDNGDMQSRAMLGRAYLRGEGVEKDPAQGMALLQDAVKAGNPVAQAYLGDLYRDGEGGLPRDLARAVALYHQGAAQGDDDGQYRLGELYEKGLGVPRNPAEAAKWYTLAAAHDNEEAKKALERTK